MHHPPQALKGRHSIILCRTFGATDGICARCDRARALSFIISPPWGLQTTSGKPCCSPPLNIFVITLIRRHNQPNCYHYDVIPSSPSPWQSRHSRLSSSSARSDGRLHKGTREPHALVYSCFLSSAPCPNP